MKVDGERLSEPHLLHTRLRLQKEPGSGFFWSGERDCGNGLRAIEVVRFVPSGLAYPPGSGNRISWLTRYFAPDDSAPISSFEVHFETSGRYVGERQVLQTEKGRSFASQIRSRIGAEEAEAEMGKVLKNKLVQTWLKYSISESKDGKREARREDLRPALRRDDDSKRADDEVLSTEA